MKRVVLVTGASRGLGASIAKLFLDNGDIVYINYNKSENKALESFNNYNKARFVKCDVSSEEEVINMFNKIKEEEGKVDILINNAGISIDSELRDKSINDFKKVLDVNLVGVFLTCKYVKKLMNKGVIINISSTNGIDTNYPYSMDYDASKSGVISLTYNFASEYAPNIRVNTVAPGWIDTDMNKDMDITFKNKEIDNILLNRFASPNEIAQVVFFLCSDSASYVNSSVIRVDGGLR